MSEKTILSGDVDPGEVDSHESEGPAAEKRTLLWIGLGALALILLCACVLVVLLLTGIFTFQNLELPQLGAEPAPLPTLEALATAMPIPQPTDAPALATATEAVDEAFERASRFAGEWQGQWVNQTFGSSGAARGSVEIDPDGSARFIIDFDGFVFGVVDPPAKSYEGSYSTDGSHFEADDDPLFGDLRIDVDAEGNMVVSGEMVPVEGIASFSGTGTLTESTLQLDYTVQFPGGGEANGIIEMTKEAGAVGSEPVTEFLAMFEAAMKSGDLEFLMERLHPAVIDRYGESACSAYLERVVDPDFSVEVGEINPPSAWNYDQDGVEEMIEEAWSAQVAISAGGQAQETLAHYAMHEGTLRWFTDCGEPIAD